MTEINDQINPMTRRPDDPMSRCAMCHHSLVSVTEITTRQHAFVKRCRAVVARRGEDGIVLLDGEHLEGLLTDGHPRDVVAAAAARGVPLFHATSDILAAASPVRTPTGVVALARWAPASIDDALSGPAPLVVGLVGVQDPGNVGSMLRSAAAASGRFPVS